MHDKDMPRAVNVESLQNAFNEAIEERNVAAFKDILSDAEKRNQPINVNEFRFPYGRKLLHIAAFRGSNDIVSYLLQTCDANVNIRSQYRRTPLMEAARKETMETFKYLLEHGANINAMDIDGRTAMHSAAIYEENEIVDFVLDNNDHLSPDLNAQVYKSGSTPFHCACRNCSARIIERMLHCGADLDMRNSIGSSALHYAASNHKHPQAVELLLNLGLDVTARDNDGNIPLHLATSVENARLLIDHGANLDALNNKGWTPDRDWNHPEEASYTTQDVRDFLRLVRETRQRPSSVVGLDQEETDQDRANHEGDNNSQENE